MQKTLAEALIEPDDRLDFEQGGGSAVEYSERFADQELMKGVAMLEEGNETSGVLELIDADAWEEGDPHRFAESLYSSQRGEFLTPYSLSEFSSMNLYKLKSHNMGFAIKNDGDVIAVHNNAGIRGAGPLLMQASIRNGGTKLDHFDGFLTNFYNQNGFGGVVNVDAWNDDYAPDNWKYEPVNIWDPRTSVYAEQLQKYTKIEDVPQELRAKIQQYESGRPDIVYRSK